MSFVRANSLVVLAVAAISASSAHAQTSNKALAEALFQDARDLLDAGRVSEACVKFAASQRVEAKLGTLMNLAACHEREGKTASAWAEFTEAITQASRANQADREQFAREHATALEARLSRLVLVFADANAAVDVTIDQVAIDRAAMTTAVPVDPGAHVVTVSSAGKKSWSQRIVIVDGPSTQGMPIPALENESSTPVAPVAPTTPAVAPPLPDRPAPPVQSTSRSPVLGWTAIGIGAVGVGVGTVFGVRAFTKKADAGHECDGEVCSQRGLDLWSDAKVSANVATIAFGVAAVAVGVGIYLLVSSDGAAVKTTTVASTLRRNGLGVSW